ncbi:hypothetical protein OH768_47985 [Streptomyces sp. NBC_01622]|uniref:hypothetical protein n=1 Tax=Streptomyces sp. NBC_01622 TaxID=2975903 RepID=UPI00386C82B3|nr:hypothetical protein OH768_47985 [Streptomyces sp. NBC_01622]
MSLHAQHFFTDLLALPVHERRVIGDACYAVLSPDSPLRLRIEFAQTIRHREYGGLRLSILHPDRGALDHAYLSFADHGTFAVRDARLGRQPGHDGYGVVRDWHDDDSSPWTGAAVRALSHAVQDYLKVWTPEPSPTSSADSGQRRPTRVDTDPEPARGCWLTDADFLTRLHQATLLWLDIVNDVLDDDFHLPEALTESREHAAQLLNIPPAFGLLIEAEAAARIVHAAGLPAGALRGTSIAQGLSHIATLPIEDQHHLVRAAIRSNAIDPPVHLPGQSRPAPPPHPSPARTR